jgi:hypothetical protein
VSDREYSSLTVPSGTYRARWSSLGYEQCDASLCRLGVSHIVPFTWADWQAEVASGSRRLRRPGPSRGVPFTNPFTSLAPGPLLQGCKARHASPDLLLAGLSRIGVQLGLVHVRQRRLPAIFDAWARPRIVDASPEHLIRSKIPAVQRRPQLSDRPAGAGCGQRPVPYPGSSRSVVSIRVSKIR